MHPGRAVRRRELQATPQDLLCEPLSRAAQPVSSLRDDGDVAEALSCAGAVRTQHCRAGGSLPSAWALAAGPGHPPGEWMLRSAVACGIARTAPILPPCSQMCCGMAGCGRGETRVSTVACPAPAAGTVVRAQDSSELCTGPGAVPGARVCSW